MTEEGLGWKQRFNFCQKHQRNKRKPEMVSQVQRLSVVSSYTRIQASEGGSGDGYVVGQFCSGSGDKNQNP